MATLKVYQEKILYRSEKNWVSQKTPKIYYYLDSLHPAIAFHPLAQGEEGARGVPQENENIPQTIY